MNKEELEKQLADIDMVILSDLRRNLAEEKDKPADERDERAIAELEEVISRTERDIISASQKRSFESVMKMLDEYEEPKHPMLYKRLSIAAACLLVMIGLNTASLKVFGQNIFSAAYQFTKTGIVIFPDQPEDRIDTNALESDPYDIKAKCAEYGFSPEVPRYIPDEFVLDKISVDSDDHSDSIIFSYKKGDIKLQFSYDNYKTDNNISPIGFPADTSNVTEEQINGHTTYILKENDRFTAAFYDEQIRFEMSAEDLGYDECYKILNNLS